MNGFARRAEEPELMDLQGADPDRLLRTVRQFTWTNLLFSRARTVLRRHVLESNSDKISILDVGAGGGDLMRWLVDQCRRRSIAISVVCLDSDERIVPFARTECKGYPEIDIRLGTLDSLGENEQFDYVFCNNFLHHIPSDDVPSVLDQMANVSCLGLIVSDIHRSPAAWFGYGLFATLFLHRSFARYDGLLSIRKGFLAAELRALAAQASLAEHAEVTVTKLNPSRLILHATNLQQPGASAVKVRERG